MSKKSIHAKSFMKFTSVASVVAGLIIASASVVQAQVTNFQWIWNGNGSWSAAQAWSEPYDSALGAIGSLNWSNLTRFDRVTIGSGRTVTADGTVRLYSANRNAVSGKTGTFNALSLIQNGNLIINHADGFRISSSSGGYVRNALISSGSTLTVNGMLITGAQDNTNDVSTWDIQGRVTANSFLGQQGAGNIAGNDQIDGGYVLNINGGSMEVSGQFDWRTDRFKGGNGGDTAASTSLVSTAQINLSNGGVLIAGSMTANWIDSSNAFVNFVDGSGSLTFGKTNFAALSDVQSLITSNHIRKGVAGTFQIDDNGTNWTVTVVPEASSVMLVMAGLAAGAMAFRSLRKSGKQS